VHVQIARKIGKLRDVGGIVALPGFLSGRQRIFKPDYLYVARDPEAGVGYGQAEAAADIAVEDP